MMLNKFFVLFISFTFFVACGDDIVYSPKPRGFPKVEYPEKVYQGFTEDYCKISFDYPQYAKVIQDTVFFSEKPVDPCWFDVYIAQFNARIHCSYYPINKGNTFDKLRADAFEMVGKHNMRADYINEFPIKKPNGIQGFVFDIEGPAASPFQFYLTDSTTHFLRGALYFNTQARPDSLAPIYEFVKTDIMHMINTFEWKE